MLIMEQNIVFEKLAQKTRVSIQLRLRRKFKNILLQEIG